MMQIDKKQYPKIYDQYLANPFFFPLIASVLLDEQDGFVYANDIHRPTQVYVEHAFGFAQIFGEKNDQEFERKLETYLFVEKQFHANKVRLYAPCVSPFLLKSQYESLCTTRQRFLFPSLQDKVQPLDEKISFGMVDKDNVSTVDKKFNLVTRFWRNGSDFILKSQAIVVKYLGEPAAICYSAAQANHCMEIDVLTSPEYRHLGLGKQAVNRFIHRCFELKLSPLWDCFTNNLGSMNLCKSVGFTALNEPYLFFTINK